MSARPVSFAGMPTRRPSRRDFLRASSGSAHSESPQGERSSEPAVETYLMRFERAAMGCQFEVLLNADQAREASESALEALELVEFLEGKLSLYRNDSDLCQLNRQAAAGPQIVDEDVWPLLEFAEQLYRETEGAFDITMTPLSRLWGFHRREGRLPSNREIAETLAVVGMHHVRLDPRSRTVEFLRPGIELSFAALGKGYALDKCDTLLASSGCRDYLLHGGYSSILGRGRRLASASPGEGWTIALRDPDRAECRLGRLVLRDAAVGTSGLANQSFVHRGRRYGHLLDPRTGRPVEGLVSVTAVAPDAMRSDALSTAFFVLGPEQTAAYCADHPDVGAILVLPGGGPGRREVEVIGAASSYWIEDE